MSLGAFDMKPRAVSDSQKAQDEFKGESATMISEHGKEVLVAKDMIANHLDRGFILKTTPLKKNVKKVSKKNAE